MPYLNLDIDYFSHPKTVRLVGLLGKGAAELPIRLWAYCGKHFAEDGNLTGHSTQAIETFVGWWGEKGRAVEAMVAVGFLDETENGFQVHDWTDHAGHLAAFKQRALSGAKRRWSKYAPSNACSMLEEQSSNAPQEVRLGKVKKKKEGGPGETKPPDWLPNDEWLAFVEHRRKMGKPISAYGRERAFAKLEALRKDGQDVAAVLRQSIMENWQGVFPVSPLKNKGNGQVVRTPEPKPIRSKADRPQEPQFDARVSELIKGLAGKYAIGGK